MQAVWRVLGVMFLATYPFIFYVGIAHGNLRVVTVLLLLVFALKLTARSGNQKSAHFQTAAWVPLTVLGVLVLAALMDDRRLVLALPVLVNAVLLLHFAGSLRGPMSVVERIARLEQPELSPPEIRYCRSVTWLWVTFFLVNGLVAGVLALTGPLSLWAVYTGLVSYVLIGAVFAGEFVVRRARFRRFGNGLHDRFLKLIWPEKVQPRERPPCCH